MYGILLSAGFSLLRFLVSSVLVKFGTFFALFFITTGFVALIVNLLPNASSFSTGLAGLSNDTWYFLDVFAFSTGVPMIISAYVTRFIIRRIPVIG